MRIKNKNLEPLLTFKFLLVPGLLSLLAFGLSQINYLAFHTFVEFFAIIISFAMFAMAWATYDFSKNNFLIYLACGYFWVGSLDMLHALTYKGIDIFSNDNGHRAVQFWIGTRYYEALLLLSAPQMASRPQNKLMLFSIFGVIAISLGIFIFSDAFPDMYIAGHGLTNTKIYSEYMIILMLLIALFLVFKSRTLLTDKQRILISASIVLTMCAELAFTFYVDMYDLSNFLGHIFKLFSFWFIFSAIIQENLQKPYLEVQRLSRGVEQSPASVIITDPNGRIEYANKKFETVSGYSFDEILGQTPRILKSGETSDAEYKHLWETISSGGEWRGELHNKHKDGSLYWERAQISPITDPSGSIINYIAVKEDITESKRANLELQFQANIIDSLMEGVVLTRLDEGKIVYTNPQCASMFGYEPGQMIGADDFILYPEAKENEGSAIQTIMTRVKETGSWRGEVESVKKDGTNFWCYTTVTTVNHPEYGPVAISTHTDMTDQIQLKNELHQSQKMDVIGQLTGGVAHDFNNLLGIMIGNAELLGDSTNGDEVSKHRIEALIGAVERAASLTGRLLAFSRQEPLTPQRTNIEKLLFGLEEILERTLGVTIDLEIDYAPDLWQATIDPHQFENALINLAINARDAMPGGGALTIEANNVVIDEVCILHDKKVMPGDFIQFQITDTGTGMPSEVLEKVFEPFFTTKNFGKGSGLGLSMVHGFITQSDGFISIDSEVGHGTTIEFCIPRSEQDTVQENTGNIIQPLDRGTANILIVEDNEDVRKISANTLRAHGYSVIEAGDGHEAVDYLKNNNTVDLLFTDIILPGGINGIELGVEAKHLRSNIKILYTTGYAEDTIPRDKKQNTPITLLNKPYRRVDLLKKVETMLLK